MKRLLLIFALFITVSSHASPNFDCKKASTEIERSICGNDFLSRLDTILNIIYKKNLALSKNPSKIKAEQREWINKRNKLDNVVAGSLSDMDIGDIYCERIKNLLTDKNIRTPLLEECMRDPFKVDSALFYLAAASLWEELQGKGDWHNLLSDLAENSKFLEISEKKIILALETANGAYRQGFTFITLYKEANDIKMKPFLLPFTKTENEYSNSIMGGFLFSKKNGKWYIDFSDHPSSMKSGDSCEWEIDENGDSARIIAEELRPEDYT